MHQQGTELRLCLPGGKLRERRQISKVSLDIPLPSYRPAFLVFRSSRCTAHALHKDVGEGLQRATLFLVLCLRWKPCRPVHTNLTSYDTALHRLVRQRSSWTGW